MMWLSQWRVTWLCNHGISMGGLVTTWMSTCPIDPISGIYTPVQVLFCSCELLNFRDLQGLCSFSGESRLYASFMIGIILRISEVIITMAMNHLWVLLHSSQLEFPLAASNLKLVGHLKWQECWSNPSCHPSSYQHIFEMTSSYGYINWFCKVTRFRGQSFMHWSINLKIHPWQFRRIYINLPENSRFHGDLLGGFEEFVIPTPCLGKGSNCIDWEQWNGWNHQLV